MAILQGVSLFWAKHTFFSVSFTPHKLAQACFLLVVASFLILVYAFIASDFSVELVASNSHSLKPLLYKISALWANHEGSMFLWVLIHTFMGALYAWRTSAEKNALSFQTLGFHGFLSIAFIAFLLWTSNPFLRLWPPPIDGRGLNPILQDPALAFHPPFLYLGYVGYSLNFCLSLGLLMVKTPTHDWAKEMRFWVLLPWSMLTIGIALGSFWAYYELGWGGWWFWDPVENASLMPWLLGTALLHVLILVQKRQIFQKWALFLALFTFHFSVFGTFLVRSGLLSSVHSFASDPLRGSVILALLGGIMGGSLVLYWVRSSQYKAVEQLQFLSKETSLIANNLFLGVGVVTVLLGTIYPYMLEFLTHQKISVGPPYFEQTFLPLMIPFCFILPIAPYLNWGEAYWPILKDKLVVPLSIAFTLALLIGLLQETKIYSFLGLFLALWIILGTLFYGYQKIYVQFVYNKEKSRPKLFHFLGVLLGHLGFGIALLGMVGSNAWHYEKTLLLQEGNQIEFAGYIVQLKKFREHKGPNYLALIADMNLYKKGQEIDSIRPERRLYPVEEKATTEVALYSNFLNDLYVVLGEEDPLGRGWSFKFHYYPLVPLIWLGALLMALGGFAALLGITRRAQK